MESRCTHNGVTLPAHSLTLHKTSDQCYIHHYHTFLQLITHHTKETLSKTNSNKIGIWAFAFWKQAKSKGSHHS